MQTGDRLSSPRERDSVTNVFTSGSGGHQLQHTESGEDAMMATRASVAGAIMRMQSDLRGELKEDQLQIFRVLGRGGFGTVYHGASLCCCGVPAAQLFIALLMLATFVWPA